MSLLEMMKARYSVRKFTEELVSDADLHYILEAGQAAPTALNYQPQRILVLRSQEALAKLPGCTRSSFGCTLALIVCYDPAQSWKRSLFYGQDSGWVDASIVIDHMMLAAQERGLGSTWVMSFDPAAMRTLYNIPDTLVPVSMLVLGHPAPDAEPAKLHGTRKPIDELVTYDHY